MEEDLPLREYQKQGVHFLKSRAQAMLCDDPGLGKTRQMIQTCRELGLKTLVICPRSVKDEWKTEINKWTSMKVVIINGNPAHRRWLYLLKADFHIMNYETVLKDIELINKIPYDCIVLDEAQRIKNCKTLTAQTIKKIRTPTHRYILTATPIENKIEELYSLIEFIGNGVYTEIERTLLNNRGGYSGYVNTSWGKGQNRFRKALSKANPERIHAALQKFMLRRRKEDVDVELPEKSHFTIETPMADRQRMLYQTAKEEFMLMIEDRTIPITNVLAQITYLREICNSTALVKALCPQSPKLDELIPRVVDVVESGNKVLVFSEFKRMCDIIVSELKKKGIGVSYLHGQEKAPEAQKRAFWGPNQVLVATKTGEAGHNLQCASYVFHFEPTWNPARVKQREDRAHRLGQEKPVFIYGFMTPNSIEERIQATLEIKQDLFEKIIDRPEYRQWLRSLVE
jgi:SNF2 family DNA or RNA helicase